MGTTHAGRPPGLHLLPQTRTGWLAVYCFVAFAATAAVSGSLAATVGGSTWMALFTIPFALSALGSGVAGVIAVVRRGDRGALLFLPLFLALVALFFIVGEFVSPH